MKRDDFRYYSMVVACLMLASFFIAGLAQAQTKQSVDPVRLSTEQWLKEIPDYERRLYERVKKSNHQNLDIVRVAVFSALLIIVLVPGLTIYFVNRKLEALARTGAASELDPLLSGAGACNPRSIHALVKRQKMLIRAHDRLLAYVEDLHADRKDIEALVRGLKSETKDFHSAFSDVIDQSISKPDQHT